MKITEVKPMVVENDPPYIGGRHLVFVQIVTDEGIVGTRESGLQVAVIRATW